MTTLVHWHEGLFMKQHHLQEMQRVLTDRIDSVRKLAYAYPYGLVEARLSADALENLQIRFESLRVVMPSGVEVSVPDNCELALKDIKQPFESGQGSFTVSLGVPLWDAHGANTVDQASAEGRRAKRLYYVGETDRKDENSGEGAHPVHLRRINARLLLESDDQADMEVIPLLRISHGVGEDVGMPRQDPAYIPPCLVLSGSPSLRELARDMADKVEASRTEKVIQLTRAGFDLDNLRGRQLQQMMKLQTLNRFAARLRHLAIAPSTTPFEMYIELRTLLGELAALHPDRDPFEVAPYDHERLAMSFQELCDRIRVLLTDIAAPRFIRLPFRKEGDMLVADLTDEHVTQPNEYFLGIKTREDPRVLSKLVEDADQFKFMARKMAKARAWGVKLTEERYPPLELPAETGLQYYRLIRSESERMWTQIVGEKAIAIRWPDVETSDYDVALFMTVPEGEGS